VSGVGWSMFSIALVTGWIGHTSGTRISRGVSVLISSKSRLTA
jgi:hypothetical protein